VLSFVFFVVLARYSGRDLFGVVRAALSAAQIGAGLGVPYLTSISRLAGLASDPEPSVNAASVSAKLQANLSGWFALTLLGALVGSIAYGWGGGGSAVFLTTIGFGCNYLGVLLPKSYQMTGTLMSVSLWGNATQLLALFFLMLAFPSAVTINVVLTIYSCAFIVPVLLTKRLRPFTSLPIASVRTLWTSTRLHGREYGSLLAQHISHILVISLDLVVLSRVSTAAVVGGYAAVKSIVIVVLLPATALFHLLIPAAVRRLNRHPDPGDSQIRRLGIGAITAASVATIVASPSLMSLVYGSRFSGLGSTLLWAVVGAYAYGLSLFRGATWIAQGRAGVFSILVGASSLLEGAALLVFPTLATPLGAAQAWAVANGILIVTLTALDAVRHLRQTQPRGTTWRPSPP
jgi:O-antigen/teichoic acid export membrane protein